MKKIFLVFTILILVVLSSYAQPPEPGEEIPIDGGIGYLIAAGLFIGGKKLYDLKKKNK